jgi:cytosine permease
MHFKPQVRMPHCGAVQTRLELAVTGLASDLVGFFSVVGASFSPICGAIAADYLGNGREWAGPRPGINWAGYGAWAAGFLVGIIPILPVSPELKSYSQPAPLYSFIVSFAVYFALAKSGLEPPTAIRDIQHETFAR